MQKRTRNTGMIVIGLMGVLGVYMVINIFGAGGCAPKPALPALSGEAEKTYADFIAAHAGDTSDFIARQFAHHDVVFVNNTLYHTTFEPVRRALPALFTAGVKALGVDYLLADDQAALDALLSAEKYDEAAARKFLAFNLIPYAYLDELALLKDVWTINRGRKPGDKPLRVLGLAIKINFDLFQNEAYKDRKDLQKASFNGVTQDEYAWSVIDREVVQQKAKALVWARTGLVLKNGLQKSFSQFYLAIDIPYRGTMAMLARQKLGDRAAVLLFHNTWPLAGGGSAFPVGGVLDAGMKGLPEDKTAAAFASADSPCRDLPFTRELAGADGNPVSFKDVCDAYLLAGPLYRYKALLITPGSLTKEDIIPFLKVQGVKPENIDSYTVEMFVSRANQDIAAVNNDMAGLPH